MRWAYVPGYGSPGRDIPFLDKDANWVAYLDRHLFPGRLYEGTRDPEGLLSTLPAIATTLLGMLTGMWLRTQKTLKSKVWGMVAAGILGLMLGMIWGHWFPINKKLWTSSYVLLAAGWALIGLACSYWAVEIKQWKRGWTFPWLVFGSNAISAYVFAELLSSTLANLHLGGATLEHIIYANLFAPIPNLALGSLLYSLTFVAVCFIPALVLYWKKVFIKI
jgi:predicted acyltransferase